MAKITDFAVPGSIRKGGMPALQKKAPPKKKRAQYKMTVPMKKNVQKLINANIETQQKTLAAFGGSGAAYVTHAFSFNPRYVASGQQDIIKLISPIDQGVERDQRRGSHMSLMSLKSRMHFYLNARADNVPSNQHFHCRLLVLSCKKLQKYSDLVDNWESGMALRGKLLKPDSDYSVFQNDPYSINWAVNRELFTVHKDKKFTMNRGWGVTSGSGSGYHQPTPFKTFSLSLKVKSKKLLFAEAADQGASNWAPFAILLVAPTTVAGGSIPGANDVSPISGNAITVMTWKDA